MELVLATRYFGPIGGSDTYLLTVAESLRRLGHDVTIYAVEPGEMAHFARRRGNRVASALDHLPRICDGVVAQDASTALDLAERYPEVPRVFIAHTATAHYGGYLPPQADAAVAVIVVLNDRIAARLRTMASAATLVRMRQPIDLRRFTPLGPPAPRPRRLLSIGNWLRGARRRMVEEVCDELGIEFGQVGRHGRSTLHPERAMADADVVLGFGRSLLEAMACGRPAYVFDHLGGDGWVTRDSYPALEGNGFAGGALDVSIDRERLVRDLRDYSAGMGATNRDLVCAAHSSIAHASDLVELLRGLGADGRRRLPGHELARLVRVAWQAEEDLLHAQEEAGDLRRRLHEADSGRDGLVARAVAAEEVLESVRATRRYRFAQTLSRPLDAVRRRRS